MSAILLIEWVALLLLLFCSAFFSSSETAMFSLNPVQVHRLRRARAGRGEAIASHLAAPTQLLSTILIGNTFVNVAAAALGYSIAEHFFPGRGEAVSIPAMTALLLIFGEVAPKRLAMSRAEKLAVSYVPILGVLVWLLTPLRLLLETVSRIFRRSFKKESRALTEDEFRSVVEVGEEEGVLDEEERTMVDGIIRLEETQVSDVMTPRVDLIGIDLDDPPEERRRAAESVQFRFLPVYRDSLDQAMGFLDVPRFLLGDEQDIGRATAPPFFVPETCPLDTLLATFQRENRRVAFVADEFGGTAGLVTRGDILEEIARDVDNEYGEEEPELQKVGRGRWLIDGSTSLEDINYELDLDLEAEGADRISGWAGAQMERMPRAGDVVESQGCRVTVRRVRQRRVLLVLLEKVALAKEPEETAEC